MAWRMAFGWVTLAGFVLLVWDLLTIGRYETRTAETLEEEPALVHG